MLFTPLFILSAVLICGSFVVGWIADRVLLEGLIRIAERLKGDRLDVFLISLRGVILLWFVLLGILLGVVLTPMKEEILTGIGWVLRVHVILSFALVIVRIGSGTLGVYTKNHHDSFASTTLFTNLARLIIILIGALLILQAFNIPITPLLTTLGVGGLAVALALQDTLANLFAGLYLIASKKIRIGDYVKLDNDHEGYVTDINWRNTTIRTLSNNMMIVSNAELSNSFITNYQLPDGETSVVVPVGVSYDSDLEHVEQVTIDVARAVLRAVDGGIIEFEPLIRYTEFADYSIKFNVILRGQHVTNQHLLRHTFIKRLHERYRQEGIDIPFPIRTIYSSERNGEVQKQADQPSANRQN